AEVFGYANDLRARTEDRATCSIRFDRYEPLRGPDILEEDRSAPVAAPHTPLPKSRLSGTAIPEPGDEPI
ncbi:MAG: hypothetical protein ACREMY_32665, partial [bacterium]